MKPFRFGAAVGNAVTARDWREKARAAEAMGYSTFLLPDHFVTPLAPMVALGIAAEATTTLRVGTMVIDNDFRHPALLAKEAATLDLLTDGRLELGIGAGWHEGEYRAAGLSFDPPGTRIARLAEGIAILKGLWRGEVFSFEGEHYSITDLPGMPAPLQPGGPPLMIGGGAEKMLRLAAREADIVSLAPAITGKPPAIVNSVSLTAEGIVARLRWIREEAGERDVELSTYYSGRGAITDDPRGAAQQALDAFVQRAGPLDLTVEQVLASPMFLFGSVEELKDILTERRERFGLSYLVITDDMVEPFAPVVAALAGT